MKTNKLIVILGPTASGKSRLGVKLAKKYNGEIISADSRQVYKGMDIGTAKITKREMENIPHHLLDVADPKRNFNVARYQKLAFRKIKEIQKRGKLPFLVGGSPFYLYSIIEGWILPKLKPDMRLRKELEKKSLEQLLEILKKRDPRREKSIDRKNKRRIIRAIEITEKLGEVPKLKKRKKFKSLILGIIREKEEIRRRIKKRLKERLKKGMIKEVERLRKSGLSWRRLEKFGLEYRYVALFLQKKINRQEMIEKIEKASEKLAKEQMRWFKRDKNIIWIKNLTEAEKKIKKFIKTDC